MGTALFTRRFGNEVGRDDAGNVYYQDKKRPGRRWVIYDGNNDGSRVPPDWQLWLRGTIDDLPDKALPPVRKFQTEADPQSDRHDGGLPARTARSAAARSGPPRPAITSPGSPNKRDAGLPHRCWSRSRSRRAAAAPSRQQCSAGRDEGRVARSPARPA